MQYMGLLIFLFTSSVWAVVPKHGNSGNVVVCRSGAAIRSVTPFNSIETKARYGWDAEVLGGKDLQSKFTSLMQKLSRHNPSRANAYLQWMQEFAGKSQMLSGQTLMTESDWDPKLIPAGCTVERVIFVKLPKFATEKIYFVNSDLWQRMSADTQANMLLESFFFREILELPETCESYNPRRPDCVVDPDKNIDSIVPEASVVRDMTAAVNSVQWNAMTYKDYVNLLALLKVDKVDYLGLQIPFWGRNRGPDWSDPFRKNYCVVPTSDAPMLWQGQPRSVNHLCLRPDMTIASLHFKNDETIRVGRDNDIVVAHLYANGARDMYFHPNGHVSEMIITGEATLSLPAGKRIVCTSGDLQFNEDGLVISCTVKAGQRFADQKNDIMLLGQVAVQFNAEGALDIKNIQELINGNIVGYYDFNIKKGFLCYMDRDWSRKCGGPVREFSLLEIEPSGIARIAWLKGGNAEVFLVNKEVFPYLDYAGKEAQYLPVSYKAGEVARIYLSTGRAAEVTLTANFPIIIQKEPVVLAKASLCPGSKKKYGGLIKRNSAGEMTDFDIEKEAVFYKHRGTTVLADPVIVPARSSVRIGYDGWLVDYKPACD